MQPDTTPAPIGADAALAQLRHLYDNLTNGGVRDTAQAKRIAEGLLAPAIAALERATLASAAQPADFDADRAMREQAAPAAAGIPGNFITHRHAWRNALGIAKAHATGDDVSYWEHELAAFDRSFDRLWALMQDTTQPAPAAVMVPHEQMTEEIDNVLSDPDTQLSPGAERALHWLRTWTDAPLVLSATPTTQAAPQQEPVAWRHSKTLCLYETKAEVPLSDGDEWAEPLYLAAPQPAPVAHGDARVQGLIAAADYIDGPASGYAAEHSYTEPSPMAKVAAALRQKAEQEDAAYQARRSDQGLMESEWGPMEDAPPHEDPPMHVAVVEGDDAVRTLQWNRDVAAFAYPVGTLLYAARSQAKEGGA